MFEYSIDFDAFLMLTGTQLGEYSLYLIETTGVRARDSEDDLNRQSRVMNVHPDVVHFVRGARLDFPTTAPKLVEWHLRNNDFPLPEWFVRATSASTAHEAAAFLDQADSELRPFAECWIKQLGILPRKMTKRESGRASRAKVIHDKEEKIQAVISDYQENYKLRIDTSSGDVAMQPDSSRIDPSRRC